MYTGSRGRNMRAGAILNEYGVCCDEGLFSFISLGKKNLTFVYVESVLKSLFFFFFNKIKWRDFNMNELIRSKLIDSRLVKLFEALFFYNKVKSLRYS